MRQRWGFDLDMSAVRLMRQEADQWQEVIVEKIDGPDIEERLTAMVAHTQQGEPVELFLPRDQILYTDVDVAEGSETAQAEIEAAMDGRTPYGLEELQIDWERTSPSSVRVAAIARDTLDEASAFAEARGLRVAGFSSLASEADFPRLPDFGGAPGLFEPEAPTAEIAGADQETGEAEAPLKLEQAIEEETPLPEPIAVATEAVAEGPLELTSPVEAVEPVKEEIVDTPVASFVRSHRVQSRAPETAQGEADAAPVVLVEEAEPVMRVKAPVVPPLNPGPPLNVNAGPPRVRTDIAASTVSNRAASLAPPKPATIAVHQRGPNPFRVLTVFAVAALATVAIAILVWTLLPLRPSSSGMSTGAPTSPASLADAPRSTAALDADENGIDLAAPNAPETNVVAGLAVPRRQYVPQFEELGEAPELQSAMALPEAANAPQAVSFPSFVEEAPLAPAPRSLRAFETVDPKPLAKLASLQSSSTVLTALSTVTAPEATATLISPTSTELALTLEVPPEAPELVETVLLENVALAAYTPDIGSVDAPSAAQGLLLTSLSSPDLEVSDVPAMQAPGSTVAPPQTLFGLVLTDIAKRLPRTPPRARPSTEAPAETVEEVVTLPEAEPVETPPEVEIETVAVPAEVEIETVVEAAPVEDRPAIRLVEGTTNLPLIRPTQRPVSAQAIAEAQAAADDAIEAAVSEAFTAIVARPRVRPEGFSATVAAAIVGREANRAAFDTPDTTNAIQAALSSTTEPAPRPRDLPAPQPAAATPQVSIPSSASVSRQATLEGAIRLNRINLIGVYGGSADRRALIRLPSGKFVKVKVGDRVDGGTVARIGDSELQYRKGGRTMSLTMPQG